jgi:hypothetical protein
MSGMTKTQPISELKKKFLKLILNIKNKGAMHNQKTEAIKRMSLESSELRYLSIK